MSTIASQPGDVQLESGALASVNEAVAEEARRGLSASPRQLSPWLFYDERGSELFEAITTLPEYYLTRTERALFAAHADAIVAEAAETHPLTVLELGAGTATKSGLLLRALTARQGTALYQPIDVSASALAEAEASLTREILGVRVRSRVANYTAEVASIEREPGDRALALYIGSSIGNFDPAQARDVLRMLHSGLEPGDMLLLGTDLAPGPHKSVDMLVRAYDDAAGVTAAFNLNVLHRLNRDIGTDFDVASFRHSARWNAELGRMEMHLEATSPQLVHLPADGQGSALQLHFQAGETIHTENSYKFTDSSIAALLEDAGFTVRRVWHDPAELFAVTLAQAV